MNKQKRKTIYTNQVRGQLNYKIVYNFLRFAPVFFIYFLALIFLNPDFGNLLWFLVFLSINIYRFIKFNSIYQLMSIIELQISPKGVTMITTKGDYHVGSEQIDAVAMKENGLLIKRLDIYMLPVEESDVPWPSGLIEKHYLLIPMIFEDHALDIIEEWDFLLSKCKNYQNIKSKIDAKID